MPRGDGTGPFGFGSQTGRGAGYCAGFSTPGYAHPGAGRGGFRRGFAGFGGGGGRGRGFRAMMYPVYDPAWARMVPASVPDREQEAAMLREQARRMRDALESLDKRLEELDKSE